MSDSNAWCPAVVTALVLAACSGGGRPVELVDNPGEAMAVAPKEVPGWDVPYGWKAETIAFPLGFAPSLEYRGVEEIRFPENFYTVGHEEYFSYTFIWYVSVPAPTSAEVVERDLVAYFDGLARAVGGAGRGDIEAFETKAELTGELLRGASGTVDIFEAFKAQAPLRLHVKAWRLPCTKPGLAALVFVASPVLDGPGWQRAEALGRQFKCP